MTFTIEQKIECIEREISFRKQVYPKWANEGKISNSFAEYQIACMESIRDQLKALTPIKQLKFGVEL